MFGLQATNPLVNELLDSSVADALKAIKLYASTVQEIWHSPSADNHPGTWMWDRVSSARVDDSLRFLFAKSSFWTSLEYRASFELATKPLSWAEFDTDHGACYVNGEFLVLDLCSGPLTLLMTWDQVLMFKDASFSRFLCGCYCSFNPLRGKEGLSIESLMKILNWQERCIEVYGNIGYGILKCVEPLFKTALFQCSETLLEEDLLPYSNMLEKMKLKESALDPSTPLIYELNALILSLGNDQRALADGFGTLKLSGHPVVDPVAGVAKVKKLATMEMQIKPSDAKDLRRNFCHLYSRGFLKKHRRFPAIRKLTGPGIDSKNKLWDLSVSPVPHLNIVPDNYPLSDWDTIRFGHEYLLDEGEDFLSLLSDRAISGKRSEIWETWKERLVGKVPKLTTSRRALLEVLTREEFKIGDIIRVVRDREVPYDLYIVCVFPKEREMKPEPRVFAMLPLEIRTYFVNLEHNLANGIFRDISEQTMTLSYLDLKRRFIELSEGRNLAESPYWTVNIELDLESWNVRMRKEVVNPISRDLDDLYDSRDTFTFIHEFFENALRTLRHPAYPPDMEPKLGEDPIPSSIAYGGGYREDDHQGGEEGLFQKGWTLLTLPMIKMAFIPFGVEFELIGQADNQVVVAKLPKSQYPGKEEISKFCREALKSLEAVCRSMGHSVKPEECIVATSGFSYGKELIVEGATIPSTLKAVSRMFPTRTMDAPTTSSCVSGIWSDGIASTEKTDLSPLTSFLTHLMTSMFYRREMMFSALHGQSVGSMFNWGLMTPEMKSELIQLLLHLPSNLGGLVPGNICSFLYKGTADPLVQSLTALSFLSKNFTQIQRVFGWIKSRTGFSKSPDFTHLLEEPFSLPLRRAADPLYSIKQQVAARLGDLNSNIVIGQILSLSGTEGKETFIDWVKSLSPYHPKVFHDLYDASPFTEIDKFASRFTNTRTLIQQTDKGGLSTAESVIGSDLSYWLDLSSRVREILKSPPLVHFPRDSSDLARCLRNEWGLGNLEDVGASCPLSAIKLFKSSGDLTVSGCDGVIVSILEGCGERNPRLTRGRIEPYLGGSTLPKKTDRGTHIVASSPPVKKAMTILQIRDIVSEPGSSTWKDITAWAESRIAVDISWLESATPKMYGGNVAHRYHTSSMPEGATLCSIINLSTRLQMSSDFSGKLGDSALDRMMSYQELYLLKRSLLSFLPSSELSTSSTYVMQLDMNGVPIASSTLLPVTGQPSPVPPELPVNYYLKADHILITSKSESSMQWRGSRVMKSAQLPAQAVSSRALREAIRSLVEDALTRKREVTRSLEDPDRVAINSSVIDVPESKLLDWDEVINACALAAMDLTIFAAIRITKSGSSKLDLGTSVSSLVALVGTAIYRSVSSSFLYLTGSPPPGVLPLIGHHGKKLSAGAFSLILAHRCRDTIQTLDRARYRNVVRDSFSSSAGTESNIVFSNLLYWSISNGQMDSQTWGNLRALCTLKVSATREAWTEDEIMEKYEEIMVLTGLSGQTPLRVWHTSPQEALRSCRGRLQLRNNSSSGVTTAMVLNYSPSLPADSSWETVGGELDTGDLAPSPSQARVEDIIQRNMLRPYAVFSTAWYMWRPIISLVPSSCAIFGVGVGGIVQLVSSSGCKVVGFETRETLVSSREHFPLYRPSLCSRPDLYQTHPLSWLTSGDILDSSYVEAIIRWAGTTSVRFALIDIEGVDVSSRLHFANVLLSQGFTVAVKIFSPGRVLRVLQSIGAQQRGLRWWPNPASPYDEVVVVLYSPLCFPLAVPSLKSVTPDTALFCKALLSQVNTDLAKSSVLTHDSLFFYLFRSSIRHPLWYSQRYFQHEAQRLVKVFSKKFSQCYYRDTIILLIKLVVAGETSVPPRISSHSLRVVSRLAGLIRLNKQW